MKTVLEQLYGLKRNRSGGYDRPHKPALVLAVLDQLETGAIGENEIKLGESNVLIEAAHLIPWAMSRNDHPSNGIALCRNHHWAMDRHLIAPCPSDKHVAGIWRVSPTLDSRISDLRELVGFDGEKVIPPEKEAVCYYPSTAALQWRAERLLRKA